jgi:hypothetical protein
MASGPIAAMDFTPPGGYAFEPEFTGVPPRPLPDSLDNGPYARRTRSIIVRLWAVGLLCLVLPYVPGVATLSYYLLPLGYLGWIGLAVLALAAARTLHYSLRRGPFRYVRDGVPLVARVARLSLEAAPAGHGLQAYRATLVYRHPETGALLQSNVKSNDITAVNLSQYEPSFGVGDYVTAVYLPGRKIEKTLRLYAFLELSPDTNIRRAQPASSPLKNALGAVALVAFLFVLFGNVYALERYAPLDLGPRQVVVPAVVGVVLFGGLFFAAGRAQGRAPSGAGARVAGLVLSSILLGSMSGVCWSFMANAWLDRGPAQARPALVREMWMKTYNYVFRSYEIEYQLAGSQESHRHLTTLDHMHEFHGRRAVATMRPGAFGWTWVDTIEPAPATSGRTSP